MRVIVLSRCLGYPKGKSRECDFHFKGFFQGHRVDTIRIYGVDRHIFKKKSDYILDLEVINLSTGVLLGKTRRYKKINQQLSQDLF